MRVALFCEDDGHLALIQPLIERIGKEEGIEVDVGVRNASGGSSAVRSELRKYVRDVQEGIGEFAEIIVAAQDGNCQGHMKRRSRILDSKGDYAGAVVAAVPDPHVEKWYLADPAAPARAVQRDGTASVPAKKCKRGLYKAALREAFRSLGFTPFADGIEYGPEIAAVMDLKLAARNDESLAQFLTDVRAALRSTPRGAT